jgi:SpoVK/Ycf46/Vps4 family AAA+-type ATPase
MSNLEVINFPELEKKEKNHELFFNKLNNLLDNYKYLNDGGIEKINISLIYNKKLLLENMVSKKTNIFLCYNNFPKFISGMQDLENSKFRANLDKIIQNYSLSSVNNLNLIINYNEGINNLPYNEQTKNTYQETNKELISLFVSTIPKHKFEQIVLNEEIKLEITRLFTFLETRHVIYEEWGFNEIDPEPKAVLNFYGAPGTGKTMTAHAIAHHIGCKILALNYADIESKYVGDAPKNLVKAFETAKNEQSLLFFDEADSFLGKRIENVSSSSDQAVNSLRSQLLILLENFNGIVIFATNLVNNYDRAFESRILKHINFTLPDNKLRIELIKRAIPKKLPFENNIRLTELELSYLSEITEGFSGREIKNAILDSLTNAITKRVASYQDFKKSFELAKTNKSKLKIASKNQSNQNLDLADKIRSNLNNMRKKTRNMRELRKY